MVPAELCGTIQTCVAQYGPILTQATPSTTGSARVAAYASQCSSIMPPYIESVLVQTPPMAGAGVLCSTILTGAANTPPDTQGHGWQGQDSRQ